MWRTAESAAEDEWWLNGNRGSVVDPIQWERLFKGIKVYKGRIFADIEAVSHFQVSENTELMVARGVHYTIAASIILTELCGVFFGLRRSEHFTFTEAKPNRTTFLYFHNLAEAS